MIAFQGAIRDAAPLVTFEVPTSYGPQTWSFRNPARSIVWRFFAHLLVRLLVLTPLPPQFQAAAVLLPVSVLWPLVASSDPAAERAEKAAEPVDGGACVLPLSGGLSGLSVVGGGSRVGDTLVDLTNPADPRITGELSGVGTRLALTDSNLLVSTYRTLQRGHGKREALGGVGWGSWGARDATAESRTDGEGVAGTSPDLAGKFPAWLVCQLAGRPRGATASAVP